MTWNASDYVKDLFPTDEELKWYFIDLDNTLAHQIWPDPGIGEPIEANIKKLQEVIDAGFDVFVYTARHWGDYRQIKRWLSKHGIKVKGIVCGKPLCFRFVDDKAINSDAESWL